MEPLKGGAKLPDFSAVPELAYNWLVVLGFFLAGLSAGAYLFSVVANYWMREFKPLVRTAAVIAPVGLAVTMLILLVDLGQPFRAWGLLLSPNLSSPVVWGSWFLGILFVVSLAYARLVLRGEDEKAKRYALIGIPLAFLAAMYSGVLLSLAPGSALWHTPLLPVLFLNGALISGLAVTMLLARGGQLSPLLARLGRMVAFLVLLETALIFIELIVHLNGGIDAVKAARSLLVGGYSGLFWVMEIILGALVPVIILFRRRTGDLSRAVASILVLIGVYAMRHIIVVGGQVVG
jgi:molybdopterin-containing oxidoreductase family membrane subunit